MCTRAAMENPLPPRDFLFPLSLHVPALPSMLTFPLLPCPHTNTPTDPRGRYLHCPELLLHLSPFSQPTISSSSRLPPFLSLLGGCLSQQDAFGRCFLPNKPYKWSSVSYVSPAGSPAGFQTRGGGKKRNQTEPDARGIDYSCMILRINKVFGKFLKHTDMLGSNL